MPIGPTCRVFRRKRSRGRAVIRSARTYTARVALPGQPPQDYPTGSTDKRVAVEFARARLRELEQEVAGLIAPRSVRNAAQRPLLDHLNDFVADLRSRGRDPMYVYNVDKRLRRLFSACGWKWLRDVSAETFAAWRREQTQAPANASPKTVNDYLAAMRGLLAWMVRHGRAAGNPLAAVGQVRWDRDQHRAALTVEEQNALLAKSGPRAAVYLLAIRTGLRRAEINGLRWEDLDLAEPCGVLTVRAAVAKNARVCRMTLTSDVSEVLRAVQVASRRETGLVFPKGCPSMETFRIDLTAAGIAESDGLGRRRDFHALRVTAITNVRAHGAPQAVAQQFARHSDARLTDRVYTDASVLPTAQVPAYMPPLVVPDGAGRVCVEAARGGTREGTRARDVSGRFLSRRGESGDRSHLVASPANVGVCDTLSRAGVECRDNWGSRIRT